MNRFVLLLLLVTTGARSWAANGYTLNVTGTNTLQYTLWVHWAVGACAGSWTSEGNYFANPGANFVNDVPCSGTPTDKAHFVWFGTSCGGINDSSWGQSEVLLNGSMVINGCTGPVVTNPPTHSCTFTVVNNSGTVATYQLYSGGAPVGGPVSGTTTWLVLNPGQTGSLGISSTNSCSTFSVVQMTGASPNGNLQGTNNFWYAPGNGTIAQTMPGGSYSVNDNGTLSSATTAYSGPVSGIYSNPASWGSNQPIAFTTNAVAGDTINTLQTGFGAVKAAVDNANANIAGAVNGVQSGVSGVQGAVNNLTNYLGKTSGVSSNYQAGSVYETNQNVFTGSWSTGTNGASATTAATSALGSAYTGADNLSSAVGSPPGVGAGSASGFTFAFCGTTINLDPGANLPGVASIVKAVFTWLITVGFLLWAGSEYLELCKAYGAQQTGGVPDLDAALGGFGGNAAGFAVALIVPLVFIGLWVGVFTFLFGQVLTTLTGFSATDPFGGMSGGALYLVNEFFPVSLALSLLWARLTLYFGMGKLVVVASSASRYLFGK